MRSISQVSKAVVREIFPPVLYRAISRAARPKAQAVSPPPQWDWNRAAPEVQAAPTFPNPPSDAEAERWDAEWCRYLRKNDGPRHFTPATSDQTKLLHLTEDRMFWAVGDSRDPIRIWHSSEELLGKNILEIGCGPGVLSRELAPIFGHYLGLDVSPLAIRLATLMAPANATFVEMRKPDEILAHSGTRDLMVCRDFFIHQNEPHAHAVLAIANRLLRSEGYIVADFDTHQGMEISGESDNTSQLFDWNQDQIQGLFSLNGFTIESVFDYDKYPRRFVKAVKTA